MHYVMHDLIDYSYQTDFGMQLTLSRPLNPAVATIQTDDGGELSVLLFLFTLTTG